MQEREGVRDLAALEELRIAGRTQPQRGSALLVPFEAGVGPVGGDPRWDQDAGPGRALSGPAGAFRDTRLESCRWRQCTTRRRSS
jgi:hypothetical protein